MGLTKNCFSLTKLYHLIWCLPHLLCFTVAAQQVLNLDLGRWRKETVKETDFSWTTPCCEVLKCNSRCCACILCFTVRYNPNLAFLSVPEKFWVLGDRWRCANAWYDSILDVAAGGSDALRQQQLLQPGGSQAFAAFLAPGNSKQQELMPWEMQQWERENYREQELYWEGEWCHGVTGSAGSPGSSVKPSNS